MQPLPSAQSVNSLLEDARNQAVEAAASHNTRLQVIAAEAAELSRLEVLPSGVRTALARVAKELGTETQQITNLLTRNASYDPSRIHSFPATVAR